VLPWLLLLRLIVRRGRRRRTYIKARNHAPRSTGADDAVS